MKIDFTERGFYRGEFKDDNGQLCSIQKSSAAEEDKIWLGAHDKGLYMESIGRMHLTRAQVGALIPHLQAFVDNGGLKPDEDAVARAKAQESINAMLSAFGQAAAELAEDFPSLSDAFNELASPSSAGE